MTSRIINGFFILVTFIIAIICDFFPYISIIISILGLHELYKMHQKKRANIVYIYAFIFLIGLGSLVYISQYNNILLLFIVFSCMLNDTFAYFTGFFIGKHKFSKISPNKTIEGVFGGIIFTYVIWYLINLVSNNYLINEIGFSTLNFYLLIIIILILAILGDLLESFLKRSVKCKDSGTILQSHGGILDRLDSWLLPGIFIVIIL